MTAEVTMADEAGTTSITPKITGPEAPAAQAPAQEELIAGKFKTQEEFVKAYKELESKLGAKPEADPADAPEGDEGEGDPKPDADETPTFLVEGEKSEEDTAWETENYGAGLAKLFAETKLNARAINDHWQATGEFPEEAYTALDAQGYPRETVDAWLNGRVSQSQETAKADVATIKASVGGEAEYAKMVAWATQSLSEDEKTSFNAALGKGKESAAWAVQGLYAKFTEAMGKPPKLVGGRSGGELTERYASVEELKADMRDPRYAKDPAFQAKVQRKLATSDIFSHR